MPFIRIICALFLTFLSAKVCALDLYQGETPVPDQSADARVAALGRTLLDVAVKVSGDVNAASNRTIIAAAGSPEKYMQRYEYRQEIVREDGKPTIKLYLKGSFHAPSIGQLLRNAGLGAWGNDRPIVNMFLFEGDSDLSAESARALQEQASRRGMNLRFPGGVSAADLNEQTAASLASASQNVVLGRIGATLWLSDGRTTETLSTNTLNGLTDRIASQLIRRAAALSNAPPEEIATDIVGVRSADDYGRVLKYLSALSGVKKLSVTGAQQDTLRLLLNVQGGASRIAQTVAAGKTLRVLSENPTVLEVIN